MGLGVSILSLVLQAEHPAGVCVDQLSPIGANGRLYACNWVDWVEN